MRRERRDKIERSDYQLPADVGRQLVTDSSSGGGSGNYYNSTNYYNSSGSKKRSRNGTATARPTTGPKPLLPP